MDAMRGFFVDGGGQGGMHGEVPVTSVGEGYVSCDECGYNRHGLAEGARCPECGEAAPVLADASGAQKGAGKLMASEAAWWRSNAVGLLILLIASVGAIRVALVMPIGPLSLAAVNVPGPKVGAAALIQRSIGGPPGKWGVAGTVWVIMSIVGVWLVTEPRSIRGTEEGFISVRKLARAWPILTGGAALGVLLSGLGDYSDPTGVRPAWMVAITVAVCEFPAALLLYMHLRTMAQRTGDRRTMGCFEWALWIVPIAIAIAAVIVAGAAITRAAAAERSEWSEVDWPVAFRGAMGVYGALALGAGIVATAGVGRLFMLATGRGFGPWIMVIRSRVHRVPEALRGVVGALAKEPGRWRVVLGLALLLWTVPGSIANQMVQNHRERSDAGGVLPMLNYPGPKVAATPLMLWITNYSDREGVLASVEVTGQILVAVWLMTSWARAGEGRGAGRIRQMARWYTVVAIGGMIGFQMAGGMGMRQPRPNHTVVWTVCLVEAPATALLYWHLGCVAAGAIGVRAGRFYKLFAVVTPVLAMLPLGLFTVNRGIRYAVAPKWVPWASGVYMMVSLAVAVVVMGMMARLAMRLVAAVEKKAIGEEPIKESVEAALALDRNVDLQVVAKAVTNAGV